MLFFLRVPKTIIKKKIIWINEKKKKKRNTYNIVSCSVKILTSRGKSIDPLIILKRVKSFPYLKKNLAQALFLFPLFTTNLVNFSPQKWFTFSRSMRNWSFSKKKKTHTQRNRKRTEWKKKKKKKENEWELSLLKMCRFRLKLLAHRHFLP